MKTVAIVGASADRSKYGNKALRAYLQKGYTVYPIHPREEVIEGIPAYRSVSDLPESPQMVTAYVPPAILLPLLPEIARKGCQELWLNPGSESPEVLAEAERLGLNTIQACSILGVGVSPMEL